MCVTPVKSLIVTHGTFMSCLALISHKVRSLYDILPLVKSTQEKREQDNMSTTS